MPDEIYFPPVEPIWEFDRDCVRFYAVVDKRTLVCRVSAEALMQFFGARTFDANECIRVFSEHRPAIEEVARRKILAGGDQATNEVSLLMKDFYPTTTTTPAPVQQPGGRVERKVTQEISQNPDLLGAVEKTTALLESEIVRGKTHVTASWTALHSRGGALLYLRLLDNETGASAENLFSRYDLDNESVLRFSLFRLWDDLLRKKGSILMEEYQKGENSEGAK